MSKPKVKFEETEDSRRISNLEKICMNFDFKLQKHEEKVIEKYKAQILADVLKTCDGWFFTINQLSLKVGEITYAMNNHSKKTSSDFEHLRQSMIHDINLLSDRIKEDHRAFFSSKVDVRDFKEFMNLCSINMNKIKDNIDQCLEIHRCGERKIKKVKTSKKRLKISSTKGRKR